MLKALIYYWKQGRHEWESLCNNCGKCCYEKDLFDNGNLLVDYSRPCEYLDEKNKRCTVYHNRFKVCRDCRKVTIRHALFSRYMPPDCRYVRFYRDKEFLNSQTFPK